MINRNVWGVVLVSAALVGVQGAWAEGERLLHLENTIGAGYDDNMYYTEKNKASSFTLRDELVLTADHPIKDGTGFIGLRYHLGYTWFEDRSDSQNVLSHTVDFIFNRSFARVWTLGLVDTFMRVENPEAITADGTIRRENTTYNYNTLNGDLVRTIGSKSRIGLSGRWQELDYDKAPASTLENYDIYSVGLMGGTQIGKDSMISVNGRYEDTVYMHSGDALTVVTPGAAEGSVLEVPNRDNQSYFGGLGVDKMFSPNLMGKASVGYQYTSFEAANSKSDSSPYGEIYLTVLPVPSTRITLGGTYSMYQSGISTFANQHRTSGTLSLGHDFTSKLTLTLYGTLINSDYKAKDSVDNVLERTVSSGTETAASYAARLSFRLNRNNWIEAGWTYTDFTTKFADRSQYDHNYGDISWKIRL